jgi:Cu/Ag efflux protein CusF
VPQTAVFLIGRHQPPEVAFRVKDFGERKMRVSKSMMIACLLANVMMAACTNSSSQSKSESASQATAQATPHAKRYPMEGKVVSVDKRSKMLNVDGEAIPDFMPAMVMPYEVKPESLLDTTLPFMG